MVWSRRNLVVLMEQEGSAGGEFSVDLTGGREGSNTRMELRLLTSEESDCLRTDSLELASYRISLMCAASIGGRWNGGVGGVCFLETFLGFCVSLRFSYGCRSGVRGRKEEFRIIWVDIHFGLSMLKP